MITVNNNQGNLNPAAVATDHTWMKTGKQILDLKLDKVPTLLYPFIPKYGAISLAGSSDLGKSYLLLQLADAIINGDNTFLGFNLSPKHRSVIYVSTEDDEYSLSPRLGNLSSARPDTATYNRLRVIFEANDLLSRLDIMLTESPADIVIIDTFSDIYDGEMNQANKVRSFIREYKELAHRHGTLIIFNHHCGKKNDHRPPHKDNLLGSQGFESSMRTVVELRRDFKIPDRRHLCIVKGNYIGEEYKNSSFVLEFNFEDGFKNTGLRTSFAKLVQNDDSEQERSDLEEKVLTLIKEGLSVTKIHESLKAEGISISRSSVGTLCKLLRPSIQLAKDDDLDGQAKAALK